MASTGCLFTMDMGEVESTYGVMCLGTKWFILFWAFELESVGRDTQGLRSQVTCLSPLWLTPLFTVQCEIGLPY